MGKNIFESTENLLKFAIDNEIEAENFYKTLADKVEGGMKRLFLDFAAEERGHKVKLEKVLSGDYTLPEPAALKKLQDLGIERYLVEVEASVELNYQEALILAMKKEKAAYSLYMDLASLCPDASLKAVLEGLAFEEANHKARFEMEYDDVVLEQN